MPTDDRTPPLPAPADAGDATPPAPRESLPADRLGVFIESIAYRTWLTAIVLAAVLLQVALVVSSPPIAPDGVTFCTMAQGLPNHPLETMRASAQHPGFPALVVIGRFLVMPFVSPNSVYSWIWGARLVSGVFGVLVILAAWRLADRTFGRRAAIVTAALVAVLPVFRRNAADALSDSTHLFLYLVAAMLVLEGLERRQRHWFIFAGVASGLAYWVRPEGFSVALVTACFLPLWAWFTQKLRPRSVVEFAGLTLLAAVLVALPYMISIGGFSAKITAKERLYSESKVTSHKSQVNNTVLAETSSRVVPVAGAKEELKDLDEQAPARRGFLALAGGSIWALVGVVAQAFCWVLVAPLIAGGFVRDPRSERTAAHAFVLSLVGFHVLLLFWLYWAGGYMAERHVMVIAALATPRVAAGLLWIADWIGEHLPENVADRIARYYSGSFLAGPNNWLAGALLAVAAIIPVWRTLDALYPDEAPVVQAALELQVYAKPGDKVVSNSPYVPFYAQLPGHVITKWDVASPKFTLAGLGSPYRFVVFNAQEPPFRAWWLDQIAERYERLTPTAVTAKHVRAFILRTALPPTLPPPPRAGT